jgi:hypothetical protein
LLCAAVTDRAHTFRWTANRFGVRLPRRSMAGPRALVRSDPGVDIRGPDRPAAVAASIAAVAEMRSCDRRILPPYRSDCNARRSPPGVRRPGSDFLPDTNDDHDTLARVCRTDSAASVDPAGSRRTTGVPPDTDAAQVDTSVGRQAMSDAVEDWDQARRRSRGRARHGGRLATAARASAVRRRGRHVYAAAMRSERAGRHAGVALDSLDDRGLNQGDQLKAPARQASIGKGHPPPVPMRSFVLEPSGSSGDSRWGFRLPARGGHAHRVLSRTSGHLSRKPASGHLSRTAIARGLERSTREYWRPEPNRRASCEPRVPSV